MDFLVTLSLPRIVFSIIPDLFAAYFIYMFRRDGDKRKPMAAISFIFLAGSSALQIISFPSAFFFVGNFISLEFYPMVVAVLIFLFSEILQLKTFQTSLRLFYACLASISIMVFVPFNFALASTVIIDALGIFALSLSAYLFVKKKQLSTVLILLSIASFLGYGLGWTYDLGLSFIFLNYTFGFIFVALAFSFVPIDDKSSIASIFRVTNKLDEATERLRELKLEYKTVFESANDALFVINPETSLIVECNFEATKLLDRDKKEIVGKSQKILFPRTGNSEEFAQPVRDHVDRISEPIETQVVTKKGEFKNVAIKMNTFEQGSKKFLIGIFRDITESKKAQEKINFQVNLLDHVGQAVMMVDNKRTVRYWNKAAETLYGWSEYEVLGHNVNDILDNSDSPEKPEEIMKKLQEGKTWSRQFMAKRRDGSFVPVIVNRAPIFDATGSFLGAASIVTDITEEKQTEKDLAYSLESLSQAIQRVEELNEKLHVIGSLTRHDVRNKLSAITGYAYILKKKHSDLADLVENLNKMEQAVSESVKIFDFAKMYEQLGAEGLTYMDVETKLKEACSLFSVSLPNIINDCRCLKVLADSFLTQLFYNFIDNTRKYGKKTATIRAHFERADQNNLKLIYEDDGEGVPLGNKKRLFTQGYSTGGSTGLGLFLIKKMMDVYGWEIEESGEPGKGARFVITIPKFNLDGKENFRIEQVTDTIVSLHVLPPVLQKNSIETKK
jgi:PAS domain S-box-containing protein